jgi:hypothetical protein
MCTKSIFTTTCEQSDAHSFTRLARRSYGPTQQASWTDEGGVGGDMARRRSAGISVEPTALGVGQISIVALPARARQAVEYRESGLSLNHIQGCPLDCAYCILATNPAGRMFRSTSRTPADPPPLPCRTPSKTNTRIFTTASTTGKHRQPRQARPAGSVTAAREDHRP